MVTEPAGTRDHTELALEEFRRGNREAMGGRSGFMGLSSGMAAES